MNNNEKERVCIMLVNTELVSEPWFIDLTTEQKRLFDWLQDNGFLNDCEIYNLSDESAYEKI